MSIAFYEMLTSLWQLQDTETPLPEDICEALMQKRRAFAGLLTKRQLLFGKYAKTFCFLPDDNLLNSILGCSLSAMMSLTTIKICANKGLQLHDMSAL